MDMGCKVYVILEFWYSIGIIFGNVLKFRCFNGYLNRICDNTLTQAGVVHDIKSQ